jgi:hypothetical protein
VFAELVINEAGLGDGNPPVVVLDVNDASVVLEGDWIIDFELRDKFGKYYAISNGSGAAQAIWNVFLDEGGLYEVCVWYPQGAEFSNATEVAVLDLSGITNSTIDQTEYGGRWIYLGDFEFDSGENKVAAILMSSQNGRLPWLFLELLARLL